MKTRINYGLVFLNFYLFLGFTISAEPLKPSFNCKKANLAIEKLICQDTDLGHFDGLLTRLYKKLIAATDKEKRRKLQSSQQEWIRKRNSCEKLLPVETQDCVVRAYKKRIIDLNGDGDLELYLKDNCKLKPYHCDTLGEHYLSTSNWKNAHDLYKKLCEINSDGDMGYACFKLGILSLKLKNEDGAIVAFKRSCEENQNPLACGSLVKVAKQIVNPSFLGLYKNQQGYVFIGKKKSTEKEILIYLRTSWANGHSCSWDAHGQLLNNKIEIEKAASNTTCQMKVEIQGSTMTLIDADGSCQRLYCGARGLMDGVFQIDPEMGLDYLNKFQE